MLHKKNKGQNIYFPYKQTKVFFSHLRNRYKICIFFFHLVTKIRKQISHNVKIHLKIHLTPLENVNR